MLCDVDSEGVVVDVLDIPGSLGTCKTKAAFLDTDRVVVGISVNSAVPIVTVVAETKM
jgi:hypothetical protein